jgi:hypothetical protein
VAMESRRTACSAQTDGVTCCNEMLCSSWIGGHPTKHAVFVECVKYAWFRLFH